jgi:hypothetical protein
LRIGNDIERLATNFRVANNRRGTVSKQYMVYIIVKKIYHTIIFEFQKTIIDHRSGQYI